MVWGKAKSGTAQPAEQLGDDASASALLECVVQELVIGRARNEIVQELVRHRWAKPAANRFCQLAQQIAKEVRHAPDQRGMCARRGYERIQAAAGWIGSGLVIALILWFGGQNMQKFAAWSLIIVGFGLIELMAGLTLYWPHKDYLTETHSNAATRSLR